MNKEAKILIVGHEDVIERSLAGHLAAEGFANVAVASELALDTTIQSSVYEFFSTEKPEYVFLGSIRSGGIEANQKNPAEFFYANSESQNNIVYAAWKFGVKKLMYFASSCVYPKDAAQPMKPEYLMTGPIEPTSAAYATAKLGGIALCQGYRKQHNFNAVVAVPATVYGPDSDTDLSTAHVLGALVYRFHQAKTSGDKTVTIWGSGEAKREFIFAEDFARACVFLMDRYNEAEVINIGCGEDIAIKDLAKMIAQICGFSGEIIFDRTKPDGAMRKLLDNEKIVNLGWKPIVSLKDGIQHTYDGYKDSPNFPRG